MTNCCTPAEIKEAEAINARKRAHARVREKIDFNVPDILRIQSEKLFSQRVFFHGQVEVMRRMVSTMNVNEFPDDLNYTSDFAFNARCFASF